MPKAAESVDPLAHLLWGSIAPAHQERPKARSEIVLSIPFVVVYPDWEYTRIDGRACAGVASRRETELKAGSFAPAVRRRYNSVSVVWGLQAWSNRHTMSRDFTPMRGEARMLVGISGERSKRKLKTVGQR